MADNAHAERQQVVIAQSPAVNPSTTVQPNGTVVPDRRGLLDIKVTLSNRSPTAGSEFTLYVLVTNLFDVPIWPESPQVFLPSEIEAISVGNSLVSSIESLNLLINKVAQGEILPREDLRCKDSFRSYLPSWLRPKIQGSETADHLKYLAGQTQTLDKELAAMQAQRAKIKAQKARPRRAPC
jgi:hypothetical protein